MPSPKHKTHPPNAQLLPSAAFSQQSASHPPIFFTSQRFTWRTSGHCTGTFRAVLYLTLPSCSSSSSSSSSSSKCASQYCLSSLTLHPSTTYGRNRHMNTQFGRLRHSLTSTHCHSWRPTRCEGCGWRVNPHQLQPNQFNTLAAVFHRLTSACSATYS